MKQLFQLTVENLHVIVEKKEVVKGINLTITSGQFHVLMGPNGSGKSSLTHAIMGHPFYTISGKMEVDTKPINDLSPDARARLGIMMAFQNPIAVPGVTLSLFLRTAYKQVYPKSNLSVVDLHKMIVAQAKSLELPEEFLRRSINDGFSGGEKKKVEMLQLLILQPRLAILDEIDTGLDVDSLKLVAHTIHILSQKGCAIFMITHYKRILNYLKPQFVHVMRQGKLVVSGGPELISLIEEKGYAAIN